MPKSRKPACFGVGGRPEAGLIGVFGFHEMPKQAGNHDGFHAEGAKGSPEAGQNRRKSKRIPPEPAKRKAEGMPDFTEQTSPQRTGRADSGKHSEIGKVQNGQVAQLQAVNP